ncbi:nucleotide-binding protein [Peptococcaceae bacterium SCADC1_2_3]|nr:nucleotide-binding protein [Peptococcaceae bacterium SCADC1_2_3]KFI36226.1 nucleotide-binding protein [Peptococcaceae bacterium SCADC1_2_3]KFI36359.1 nucleotide-binding protein [Peptococcaceae bacterium SCADC1_2_3]KFI37016.1 nucleotide-binding protein [Peptococcaceae bacterium SCADC1_2_3]
MNKLLLDTSVLIDHLRKHRPSTEFLKTVHKNEITAVISTITEMELYAGKSMQDPAKEAAALKLLELFDTVAVTSSIALQAGALLRQYRQHGLTPIDAIIAGTAIEEEATLVTRNIRHFRMIEGILIFDLPTDY